MVAATSTDSGPGNCPEMWDYFPDILGGTCLPTWITIDGNSGSGEEFPSLCPEGWKWCDACNKCLPNNFTTEPDIENFPSCPPKWRYFPNILGGTCLPVYLTAPPDPTHDDPRDCLPGYYYNEVLDECVHPAVFRLPVGEKIETEELIDAT